MVAWLCREAGLPAAAAGVFTAGGAHSQILGLRLARDACLHSRRQWSAAKWGLPPEARELRILCAETAQLTVEAAAAELGLGADAVVRVAVDEELDLCPDALTATLQRLEAQELRPMALMASAGAAGSGAIDPLAEIAAIARRWGAWLHVDAGCGGALLLSDRHRSGLLGIEAADSLGLDFCELLWQPVPCSVLLVRDAASLDLLDPHAEEDRGGRPEAGVPGPARRPVHGSPRLDALKLWVSLQVLGRNRLVAMLDHLLGLSREAARLIEGEPRLELLHRRVTGSVLFRYRPADPAAADAVNAAIPRHLLASGAAAVGSARAGGQCGLRLMLLHPCAGLDDLQELFARVTACGRRLERGAGLGS
jgi:L-2,4-diaminobutyrate decarboxylase